MRRIVVVALLVIAAGGCVSKWEVESDQAVPVGFEKHSWVYYPSSDVYYCSLHEHWFYRANGEWAETRDLPFEPEGRAVPLETSGPDPYLEAEARPAGRTGRAIEPPKEHRWAYWPESRVFYCHVHDHYFHPVEDGWVESWRSIDHPIVGPSHEIDEPGPSPWLAAPDVPAAGEAPVEANPDE